MTLTLDIIIGSTRPGRAGPKIGAWVHEQAVAHGGFEARLVDLDDFALPLLDEPKHPRLQAYENETTRRWSAQVAGADAFVFVTPEYDFFPPASLVNAVQVLLKEWTYKAAGVVCYGGISGGLRSAQELRLLLSNVGVHPVAQTVPGPMFSQHIGEAGFAPPQTVADGAKLMLDEVHKWAGALKPLRAAAG